MSSRDDFYAADKLTLAHRVNWNCCKPDCGAPTRGPHSASNKSVNIGVAAHITAAAPGGPRYDPTLTTDERQSIENGIWLCQSCSNLIDKDEVAFPVALLNDWKAKAEIQAALQIGRPKLRIETQFQQLVESNARLTETVARLSLQVPVAPPTSNLEEQRLARDVDRAVKWSNSGDKNRIASALVVMGEVRDDSEFEHLSTEMRSRVATVVAVCASATGDGETVAKEVQLALALNPNDPVCLSNAASLALWKEDYAQAASLADRAHVLAPSSENAVRVLVQAWYQLGEQEKVEDLVRDNTSYFESPSGLSVLAGLRRHEGDYVEAVQLVKKALRQDRENVLALEELFEALFFPSRDKPWIDSVWEFGPQTRRNWKRSEAAMGRAIVILEAGPNKSKLHQALSNRASVRSALGKISEALDDCDRVLYSDPTQEDRDTVALNKALILNRAGRAPEAIPLLESLHDERRRDEGAFVLACSYHVAGQNDKALEIWERIWQPQKGPLAEVVTAELLLTEYKRRGDDGAVAEVLRRAAEAWGESPESSSLIAQDLFDQGEEDSAISLLREAARTCLQNSNEMGRVRLLLRLGQYCYRANRFKEAAEAWEEVGWARLLPPYRSVFLNALYRCGRLDKALDVARKIQAEVGFDAGAQEIEAAILTYGGDTQKACNLWRDLANREPSKPIFAVNCAQAALQGGDEATARHIVQAISYESIKNDARSLRRVSAMQVHLGSKEAIRFAFRARQLDFSSPESHNNYVQIFLDSTIAHSIDENGASSKTHAADVLGLNGPARGEVPCTIRLQPIDSEDASQQRSITILNDGPFDHTHDIYSDQDSFARRLLDYSQSGERTFSIFQGPGLPAREYRITEVLSPYVHAFQESPSKSVEWFGEGATMWSMNIEQGLDQLFAWMDDRHQDFENLMDEYQRWHFPLCSVATLYNRSVFDLWFLVSLLPKWGIHAELGMTPPFEASIEALKSHFDTSQDTEAVDNLSAGGALNHKPSLVLDSTALLALVHLGLGEVVAPHFRLLVPVSLHRRLQHEVKQVQLPHIPSGTFARLLQWVDENVEVLPITSILSFSSSDIIRWQEALGQEELDTLLLTREHEALMLCDDVVLRQLGEFEPGINVSSVNTQHVLLFLARQNLLSGEDYFQYLETLANSNMRHLLLPTTFFGWLLEKHNCEANRSTRAAFHFLEAPMCRDEGAITITALVLSRVAVSSPTSVERALDLCLPPLLVGRPLKETLSLLQLALTGTRLSQIGNEHLLTKLVFAIERCKKQVTGGASIPSLIADVEALKAQYRQLIAFLF